MRIFTDTVFSPLGDVIVFFEGKKLCALDYRGYESRVFGYLEKKYHGYVVEERENHCGIRDVLCGYFEGDLEALQEIQYIVHGTDFQRKVWQALRNIKPGNVVSYSDIAKEIGTPSAVRAVGLANSLNPIGIIIPCHRVIAKNGKLSGYAGGEHRKKWLLKHEKAI